MAEQDWGDESFVDGSPVYGTSPTLYINVEPFTSSPEGTTGYQLKVDDGELFDAYQQGLGFSQGVAGFALRGGAGDFAAWCVERKNVRSSGEAVMSPSLRIFSGAPGFDTFRQYGVCANVSGGTLTTPSSDASLEYYADVTGWFLVEAKNAFQRHRVILFELSSGSITVLGSEDVRETDTQHAAGTAADFFRPQKLRLKVEDAGGGQSRLTAYRTTNLGPEAQLFGTTFLRTSLAAGRYGFGCQTLRTDVGGCQSVGVVNEFTIRSDAGATLFNDRFQRLQRRGARAFTDGTFAGQSLAQAWIGDAKSQDAAPIHLGDTLIRDTATANQAASGAGVSGTADEWPGYLMWQNPPKSRAQHFAATMVRENVDTTNRTEFGLVMRFTIQAFGSGFLDARGRFPSTTQRADYFKSGYAVYVVHDDVGSPVWQLEWRHFNGSTNADYESTLLATADLTSSGLVLGTSFELDVEMRNYDGTGFGQGGFVAIVAKIDGAQITPVVETGLSPSVVVTDDILVDTRSEATVDAGGVGLYCNPDALGSGNLVGFLDFGDRTLTDPPTIDPDEQASVSVAAESAGVSGTLTINEEAQVREFTSTAPVYHSFESGKVQPISVQARRRRRWGVSSVMVESEWSALDALLSSNGAHTPFNWTHPYTGDAHIVVFVESSVSFDEEFVAGGTSVYRARFEIEEVFPALTYNEEA